MDRVAERAATVLGSAWVIVPFGLWTVAHIFLTRDYVTTISDMAILIGLLILRAEIVQSKRMERDVKQDLKKSDELIKLVRGRK